MSGKKGGDKSLVLSQGQYEALKKVHPALVDAVQASGRLVISKAGPKESQENGGQKGSGIGSGAALPQWDAAAVEGKNLGQYYDQVKTPLHQGMDEQFWPQHDNGSPAWDGSYLSAPNPNGNYVTEDELADNWLGNSLHAGLTNLTHAPARLFYNIFLGGDYDPADAANGVDKFFRQALTGQDWVNEKAQASLSTIDDSTLGGKAKKYVVAPLAYNAPSLGQDIAITVASGGTAFPYTAAGRDLAADALKLMAQGAAKGAAKAEGKAVAGMVGKGAVNGAKQIGRTVIEDINHIARQPVTIERAANYFMESFNEQVGNGVDPKLAWARSLNYAIPASVIDGIGMSAASSEQIPFLMNNIRYWLTAEGKRFIAGRIEDTVKDIEKEWIKQQTNQ